MNKNKIIAKAQHFARSVKTTTMRKSPEILLVVGIGCFIGTVVSACAASRKVDSVMAGAKEEIDNLHAIEREHDDEATIDQETAAVYVRTGVSVARLYAPAVGLGVLSLSCILSSHNVMRKRNVALGAAYTMLDQSFRVYQDRVADRYGADAAREIKYDIKKEVVKEEVNDPETGKTKKAKKEVETCDGDHMASPYARFFDEGNKFFEKDPESNLYFLISEQNRANTILKGRGYLFLNEVYERLGIPATKAGAAVGWYYNPDIDRDDPDSYNDGYVDFGIYDICNSKKRDFVNGYERAILLDFNVSGDILDKFADCQHV